jgi:single-strand DNA-binding protein
VAAFGALAEAVANHIAKGRRVGITGALRQQRWTDDDGQKRSRVEVLGRTIDFLDAPRGAEQAAGQAGGVDQVKEPF